MKFITNVLINLTNKLYYLSAILLIFFAVTVTIARALTPLLNHHHHDLIRYAETILHRPVTIEKIETKWKGFCPVMSLHNVTIFDKTNGRALFKLGNLQVGLDITKSLWQHKFIINRLFIEGMRIVLTQHPEKGWVIKGFTIDNHGMNNTSQNAKAMMSWLLLQPQLVLQHVNIIVNSEAHGIQTINGLDLILSNKGKDHYLHGQAFLAKQHKSALNVVLLLHGNANDIQHLQGRFYLQVNKLPVRSWLADKFYFGFNYRHGDVSVKLWGDWRQQKIAQMQLVLQLND